MVKTSNIFPEYVLGHPKEQTSKQHSVPNKAPKARPPNSLRDKLPLHGHLPKYSGPYQVGVIDLEIPVREPKHFSPIKRNHRHALILETVLFTIYYPAHVDTPNDARIQKAQSKHNARPTWLPRPRHSTAEGYAKFASLPQLPTIAFFALTIGLTKLPAFRNARIAEHWPDESRSWRDRKGSRSQTGPPPEKGPANPKFPLILFSHGLGGTRTCYSSLCGEFASHGFIVCAVEHRDGSGPRTVINYPPDGSLRRVESEALAVNKHDVEPRRKPYDVVDFIFAKDDKYDTSPDHEIDHDLREAQVQLRCAELDEAYYLMTELAAGTGEDLKARNIRVPGVKGAPTFGLDGVDFSKWAGRLYTDHVTIIGHSFGSVTAVEMLRSQEKYQYVTQGLIYDIWGTPVAAGSSEHHIKAPVLGINSEAFMYWNENFEVATKVIEEARDAGYPAWLMTCRGTVHISQSDFCILYPRIASNVLKMTMDPVRAIDVNIDASLNFLNRTLQFDDDQEQAFRRNLPEKNYLDLDLVAGVPDEHRPKKKWRAVRLRVDHEARKRIFPHARQRYWERQKKLGHEEVWVHIAPGRQAEAEPEDDDSGDGKHSGTSR